MKMKKLVEIFSLYIFIVGNNSNSAMCTSVIMKKINREDKLPVLLKRQLPDGIDDDSSEILSDAQSNDGIGITTKDIFTLPRTLPNVLPGKPTATAGSTCACKAMFESKPEIKVVVENDKHPTTGKQARLRPRVEIHEVGSRAPWSTPDPLKRSAERIIYPTLSTTHKSLTGFPIRSNVLNETHFELREAEFQPNNDLREVCPYYKDVPELNIDKMADVWQLSYYKAHEKLTCFKIYIRKTKPQARKMYEEKYSNFNGTIDWNECYLEMTSAGKQRNDRKHFLQGSKNDRGILENIVVTEHSENETKIITLQEQTPDQWMVTARLLLMRDCDNGDVVIFSRIPTLHDMKDIEKAMKMFGEDGINGVAPCLEVYDKEESYDPRKYDILS